MGAERHHRRQVADDLIEHVLADDAESHARRRQVLLRAAVDHGVFRNIDRTGEDVRRHVGDQGHGRHEVLVVLRTVDRIVGGDMHIIQVGRNGESLRDVGEVPVLGRSQHLDLAVTLGLLDGLLRPHARIHITGFLAQEIRGDFIKIGTCTAAQIDDLVVVRNMEQLPEKLVGFLHHGVEILRPVGDRKQRKPRSVEVENCLGRIFDDLVRQDGRSRIEIVLFHNDFVCDLNDLIPNC